MIHKIQKNDYNFNRRRRDRIKLAGVCIVVNSKKKMKLIFSSVGQNINQYALGSNKSGFSFLKNSILGKEVGNIKYMSIVCLIY